MNRRLPTILVATLAATSLAGVVQPVAATATTPSTDAPALPAGMELGVRPGTEQIEITGAAPGTTVSYAGLGGATGTGITDALGAFLFRNLAPGTYDVAVADQEFTGLVVRAEDDHPAQSFYDSQTVGEGFGYLATRDGTTLSINVILPGPVEQGPYPTVIEYNGYAPSAPGSAAFGRIYTSQGFAYVGVNMRGTGCSGGTFGLFDTNNALDGYDAVETIAAQPWASGVGMVGISYGGISQLFVAVRRPPHLKAITPLSVYDDAFRELSYPGGMLNTGFTVAWMQERFDESKPFGQDWVRQLVAEGDTTCAANQAARLEEQDIVTLNRQEPFFPGAEGAGADLVLADLVSAIDVPVFLAGAWQDEQTGGHFPNMLDRFTGTSKLFVDLTNGGHTDALNTTTLSRYAEFLNLYVADRVPNLDGLKLVAPLLGMTLYGTLDTAPISNRFSGMTLDEARAAFEAEPQVRVLVESGGAPGSTPGAPLPNAVLALPSWPPPAAVPTTWLLDDGGRLVDGDAAATSGTSTYTADPTALPATFYDGDGSGVWRADAPFDWRPLPTGTGLGFVTGPLAADTVVAGSGSVDVWLHAGAATDTDLEVTISEVRPDGTEIYVQSGWLRASQRALDVAASTKLRPVQTHRREDAEPLPANEFSFARVELLPVVHPFRAGSRIRLTIDAPGGNRAVWAFDSISNGEQVTIAHDAIHPSALVLAVLSDVALPAAPPACGSIRLQPCRTYEPAVNGG